MMNFDDISELCDYDDMRFSQYLLTGVDGVNFGMEILKQLEEFGDAPFDFTASPRYVTVDFFRGLFGFMHKTREQVDWLAWMRNYLFSWVDADAEVGSLMDQASARVL